MSSRATGGLAVPGSSSWTASGRDRNHRDAAGATGTLVWGALGSRSSAIFDLDDDGDLDIVTNEFDSAPMVLISDLSEKTRVNYVAVKLTGSASNRDGLGAVVKVTAGGKTFAKAFDGNSGYLSHSIYPLYFGLGAATAVDRIEVTWPSGTKQTVAMPIQVNSVVDVKEPARTPAK